VGGGGGVWGWSLFGGVLGGGSRAWDLQAGWDGGGRRGGSRAWCSGKTKNNKKGFGGFGGGGGGGVARGGGVVFIGAGRGGAGSGVFIFVSVEAGFLGGGCGGGGWWFFYGCGGGVGWGGWSCCVLWFWFFLLGAFFGVGGTGGLVGFSVGGGGVLGGSFGWLCWGGGVALGFVWGGGGVVVFLFGFFGGWGGGVLLVFLVGVGVTFLVVVVWFVGGCFCGGGCVGGVPPSEEYALRVTAFPSFLPAFPPREVNPHHPSCGFASSVVHSLPLRSVNSFPPQTLFCLLKTQRGITRLPAFTYVLILLHFLTPPVRPSEAVSFFVKRGPSSGTRPLSFTHNVQLSKISSLNLPPPPL